MQEIDASAIAVDHVNLRNVIQQEDWNGLMGFFSPSIRVNLVLVDL